MVNDTHNVTPIEPQEIIPLINNGGIACVVDVKDTKLCLSANAAVFDLEQNASLAAEEETLDADNLEQEIQNGFSEHIAELKLRKAGLLERLKESACTSKGRASDLDPSLKAEIAHIIALILECDQCIAAVKERERERNELSSTVAAEEQKTDSNLVRFDLDKNVHLSKSSCGFFAFKPKVSSTPEDVLKPSASNTIPTVA